MRKIGAESIYYVGIEDYSTGYQTAKADGFDVLDYGNFVNTEHKLFTMSEGDFERRMLDEAAAAQAAGIGIYQVHGPWRFPPQDATEEDRAERMEKMQRTIWGASLLGCKRFVIHPIMPYGPDAEDDHVRFHDLNFEFYSKLLVTAKQCDVTICLENMPFKAHSLARPNEILAFVKEFNDDHMAMCLDTGHANLFGYSSAQALREAGNVIKALHVHDNRGAGDEHMLPYMGNIDWEDFREALKGLDESVPLSLECHLPKGMPFELCRYHCAGAAKVARYLAGD